MAQIAIKGHDTRGKEVIEILEMLNGKNLSQYFGDDDEAVYSIEGGEIVIYELEDINNDDFVVFTLEEFLEKYPYKVGDKVKTCVFEDCGAFDIQYMAWYCVSKVVKYCILGYWLSAENLQPYKEENKEETDTTNHTAEVNFNHPVFKGCNEIELIISDGWELKQIGDKMFGVRKQPQYPKTYVECAKLLGCFGAAHIDGYKGELLDKFQELLICRDAYWKIAGEEMGLDKSWEPNWNDCTQHKFRICTLENIMLVFPTEALKNVSS